ncbi:hypothetical protein BCR35DRAFT_215721 [Leucosporidium creatinivorum]|uniref:FAD-binding PCMH-type domain-containing protein n=1 Tax=Leucosporidium creatinivorum TaxID=106004 RepID=A0A1Y2D9M9_9BASI|nr:hypothetical protein BCR35DRAFT_215721 [Leucosporidium creatinivorum]
MGKVYPSTASAEGRPAKIDRPSYFGCHMNPAEVIGGSGDPLNPEIATEKREVVLPPGIDRQAFDKAIAELRETLGEDAIELNDVPLNHGNYMAPPLSHDPYSVLDDEYFAGCGAVYPSSTEDVVIIVKWANKHLIPLWTISVGRNLGYGGASPRVAGSLIVHLGRRMNKVLSVDPDTASCLLEPGVTYFDLYEHLRAVGLGEKLWIDVPDLGGGSVMGNALDRGVGYTPYGDHFAQHCGMEVVMPDGSVVRTGMMAMENSATPQAFNYGFGPYVDGMFTQSALGIVTKMGMWLMPSPGGCLPFMFTFPEHTDLEQLVDICRPLMLNRLLHNIPGLRLGVYDAATYMTRDEAVGVENRGSPLTAEQEKAIIKKAGGAAWSFYASCYGPPEIAKGHLEMIKAAFFQVPGAKMYLCEDVPEGHYLIDRANVFSGIPTFRELDWQKWIPNSSTLFFSPIVPVDGKEALAQVEIFKYRFLEYGFDFFNVFYIGPREGHNIVILLFDRTSPQQRVNAMKCMRAMIEDAAKLGWGEYRTHISLQDQVAETYAFGDGALMKLHEQMKDHLDPNGILSPGRSGIWPRRYRDLGLQLGLNTTHAETPNPVVERMLKEKQQAKPKPTYGTDELRASQKKGGTA